MGKLGYMQVHYTHIDMDMDMETHRHIHAELVRLLSINRDVTFKSPEAIHPDGKL